MTEKKHRANANKWSYVLDALCVASLFLLCTYAGRSHLATLNTGRSAISSIEMLYGPAVMLASGREFYQPDLTYSLALREFLRNERESISPGDLPEYLPEEPNEVSSYHRYLLYTVAFFWRIYGISWTSLEPLAAILLGLCAVASYGLMRLGMGRLLSVVLTVFFILSPQMFTMLPSLRDFSKAPFILALIFLLGVLIKHRLRFRGLLALALLAGLVNGTALGFRQDALVFAVPALVLFLIAVFRENDWPLWRRVLPPALFLLCFLLSGHPMLGRMEGGAQPYHPMVQGFSMKRAATLGMEPGAYEPLASGGDNYTFSMLYDYYRRVNREPEAHFEFNSLGSEVAGRQFLLDMGMHFPGDLLARGYAALLRTLRYTDGIPIWSMTGSPWKAAFEESHYALKHHLHWMGLVYAVLAMLLVSAKSLPLALGTLVFVLYICGYVSLQCEFRHAFHLSIVPLWILGFLAQRIFSGIRCLPECLRGRNFHWGASFRRMAVFALCAVVLIVAPLQALRFYQQYRVAPLLTSIAEAHRTPLAVHTVEEPGWTQFILETPVQPTLREVLRPDMSELEVLYAILHAFMAAMDAEDAHPNWHTYARYFALELGPDADVEWLALLYESRLPWNNFSQLVRLHLPDRPIDSVYYCFPAYALKMPAEDDVARNRFKGIALPTEQARAFKGLYEIRNLGRFHFLLHATITSDDEARLRRYQRIRVVPDPLDAFRVDDEPVGVIGMAEAAERFGQTDKAHLLYTAALLLNHDTVQRLYIARALLALGNLDSAGQITVESLSRPEVEFSFGASLLEEILRRHIEAGETDKAESILEKVAPRWSELYPDSLLQIVTTLAAYATDLNVSAHYKQVLLLHPEHETAANAAGNYYHDRADTEGLMQLWREVTVERPGSVQPYLRLGMVYETLGDAASARRAYETAFNNAPGHPEATIRHATLGLIPSDLNAAFAKIENAVEKDPGLLLLAAQMLENAADHLVATGDFENAARVYGQASRYAPAQPELLLKQAQALMNADKPEEAQSLLESLIASEKKNQAFDMLEILVNRHTAEADQSAAWRRILERHPGETAAVRRYVNALFAQGHFDVALELLEALDPHLAERPELIMQTAIASLATGETSPEAMLGAPVWEAHPDLRAPGRQALLQLVRQLETQGDMPGAKRLARAAALLAPESADAWITLGRVQEDDGALTEALDTYWQAFSQGEAVNQSLIAERIDAVYHRLNQQQERLTHWKDVYQHYPDNPTVMLHLGLAFEANQLWREAEELYRALEAAGDTPLLASLRRGYALVWLGEVNNGLEMMRTAATEDPALKPLAAMLCLQSGIALLMDGQPAQAEKVYRLAADFEPGETFIWLHLGEAMHAQGNMEAAQEAWLQTLALEPDAAAAAEAGRHLDMLLKDDDRVRFWHDQAQSNPDALLPKVRHALALAHAGDTEAALARSESLAADMPAEAEVLLARGLILCMAARTDDCFQTLESVLAQSPYLATEVLQQLADIAIKLFERGFPDQAEPLMRKALEMGPYNLAYYLHLGRILLAQQNHGEAAAQFRHVLLEVPESPTAARLLDEAWTALNDRDGHRSDWQAIVNAHPEAEVPRKHLDAIK